MKEGVQFPTISVVVIGDKSSGKTSILESLAGISLSTRGGQPICTRVPLIMRLQNHPNPNPELFLEFAGKTVPTDEQHVSAAISLATEEIAGKGKGLSNNPITLVVKKKGVPNLTIVDLPGITRVPVHGQPEDIHEQISKIIMEFITPEESIILNVLPACVDFCTCHREHYSALYRKLMADEDEFLEAFGGNNIGGGVFRNADDVHLRGMETSLKEEALLEIYRTYIRIPKNQHA